MSQDRLIFNIEEFVGKHITGREKSLLSADLQAHHDAIEAEIKDKSVLVIGGAGTIGSSFIRALLPYKPKKLVVVDINENGLTELVRDCRSRVELTLPDDFKSYPVNFGDPVFKKIFYNEAPFDIVANFAAHKHVRSEKDVYSIEAMVENNVLKAKRLLDLLLKNPPAHFFCVSTDKAANPVNIMGASKKLMENVILAYASKLPITTARFANVAFSNGSLLAGYIERVLKQQPLSCPSDVKRFFVSPNEAGQLCLFACVMGKSGDIFFPKLDAEKDLKNFADITGPFLHEIGFGMEVCPTEQSAREKSIDIAHGKYPVYFFPSSTSGEKLYEEFYTDEEQINTDTYQELGFVKNNGTHDADELHRNIEAIEDLFRNEHTDKSDVVELLSKLLPNFKHIETGINLDQKM